MSVAWSVLQSAKGLAVAAVPTGSVVTRKKLQHDKAAEADRQVVMVLDRPRKGELYMPRELDVIHGVTLAIVMNRSLREADAKWLSDTEEALRHALWVTTLPGVPTVRDCEWVDNPPADLSSWGDRYDVHVMRFDYASREKRNPS